MRSMLGAYETRAQVHQHAGHPLGSVDFPVTCSEQAQVDFNRAVALLHHMTYPQARETFQRVATTDPRCAMAHWGVAMTLFQPLWPTRPSPAALQRGWEAVQQARTLEPPTERERLFVAAAEAFFLEPASSDYWPRVRRWEQALERVHASFPDDPEAAAWSRARRRKRSPRTSARWSSIRGDSTPCWAPPGRRALDDRSLARTFYRELVEVADGGTRRLPNLDID